METFIVGFEMRNVSREKEVSQIHTAIVTMKSEFDELKKSNFNAEAKIREMYSLMETLIEGSLQFHQVIFNLVDELKESNRSLHNAIKAEIKNATAQTAPQAAEIKNLPDQPQIEEEQETQPETLSGSKLQTVDEICQKHGIQLGITRTYNLEVNGEISIEALMSNIPQRADAFYLALITQMKIHPRSERFPRNGIAKLIGVGLNGERIGDIYDQLIDSGLLRKEDRYYFVTDLIDKVKI